MPRTREVYYYDYAGDFGLSGLAGGVGPAGIGIPPEDDHQLGRDVWLLLDSPLPDEVIRTVWRAAVKDRFDPFAEAGSIRAWLRDLVHCPPGAADRDPYEVEALDKVRPTVPERELRAAVAAEIEAAAAGLERGIDVPGVVPALLRVVREADADLGFRLLLRVLKAYSVPVGKEQYDRFRAIGRLLAFPQEAVYEELRVRWPALDPGWRDFDAGRFGLPMLAALLPGTDWTYGGTALDRARKLARHDNGGTPGTQAAVLLEDVRRLLDSGLSDASVTAVWRAAARRWFVYAGLDPDGFDVDVRGWLEQVAGVCEERLAEVDPGYLPFVSPARTDVTEQVLREVREIAPAITEYVAHAAAAAVEDVVRSVDPDLGFRFLLRILSAYDVPVDESRRRRYRDIAASLGFSEEHVDDALPAREPGAEGTGA
ncbi:hypothetical protein AB0A60_10565 [Streptomyces sp. NPDC046275]|uniref:hypothetical protein n=1 Tax=Streptomyces sp. NPDC046275 TaxID=3157201 RepID=UPI0034109DCA